MGRPKKNPQPTGVLAERTLPDGRRKIKLRKNERLELEKSRLIEGAAALFLDTSTGRTWLQVAEELGISAEKLRDLANTKEFEEKYDRMFASLGHDPRYRAAQGIVLDTLLPAMTELRNMIVLPGTPAREKLRAIELLTTKLAEVRVPAPKQVDDREELAEFLKNNQMTINITLPNEYRDAMIKYGADVVDGRIKDPPQIEAGEKMS